MCVRERERERERIEHITVTLGETEMVIGAEAIMKTAIKGTTDMSLILSLCF